MNLFGLKSLGKTVAALTLATSASVVQAAPAEYYGMSYTWFEGGWSRGTDHSAGGNYNLDGAYLRGSFALGDNFYLLGGYSRNKDSVSDQNATRRVKGNWSQDQGEFGLGVHIPLAERVDFIGELSALYFDNDVKLKVYDKATGLIAYARQKEDRNYGGKAAIGLRAQPFEMLDIWGKLGYLKVQDADNALFAVRKAAFATLGAQLKLTPNFGLVAEADFYQQDYRYYRVGARVSF